MSDFLKITILRPDTVKVGTFKEVYRNTIVLNGVTFPFDSVCQTLRLLYPFKDVIIQFQLQNMSSK